MEKQVTLKKSFCLEGVGLHTGIESKIAFHPAPENFGYKIYNDRLPKGNIYISPEKK